MVVAFLLFWAFYVLLVGDLSAPELCVGALAAGAAAFACIQCSRAGLGAVQADPRCYPGAWRLPGRMLWESLQVIGWSYARLLRGLPLEAPERWDDLGKPCAGANEDTDRALLVGFTSGPPGSVVVVQEDRRVLINEIKPGQPIEEWRSL